jgi:hypothetical protein
MQIRQITVFGLLFSRMFKKIRRTGPGKTELFLFASTSLIRPL